MKVWSYFVNQSVESKILLNNLSDRSAQTKVGEVREPKESTPNGEPSWLIWFTEKTLDCH